MLAEGARTAAHVADEVFVMPGVELDTGGVSAESVADRERQVLLGKRIGIAVGNEALARSRDERAGKLVAHVGDGKADRDGAARTPETYAHGPLAFFEGLRGPGPKRC